MAASLQISIPAQAVSAMQERRHLSPLHPSVYFDMEYALKTLRRGGATTLATLTKTAPGAIASTNQVPRRIQKRSCKKSCRARSGQGYEVAVTIAKLLQQGFLNTNQKGNHHGQSK